MGIDLMLGLVIGLVLGFGLSLFFNKGNESASKLKELETKHEKYRKQVDDHFVNTAVLFKGLTNQYRDVYRHIASGAGELCSEEAKAIQIDLEETALLATSSAEIEVAEQLQSEVSNESVEGSEPLDSDIAEAVESSNEASINDDDEVPLASEVEMPADLAKEIKSQASKKGS